MFTDKKNINPTIANLKEREIKGLALSTIILLVIKADDHNVTKVKGIKLKIKVKSKRLTFKFKISYLNIRKVKSKLKRAKIGEMLSALKRLMKLSRT